MTGIWSRIRQIGPALVLAAVVLGPGSLTLSTIAGSVYGYRLLWVVALGTLFMIVYTVMAARIGLVTRMTLFEATRLKYGKVPAIVGGVFGFLSILSFQAGNSAAVGFSASAFLGSDARVWSVLFFFPAALLLFLPNLYGKVESLVKVIVGLMLTGFAGTLFLVGIEPFSAVRGLLPGFPDREAVFLALGMVATTFSIAAAAYQNHLVKEKKWSREDLSTEGLDVLIGIALLGAISAVVLMTSAAVLHGAEKQVFSARTMALQLEPLAGPAAYHLFNIGFFFAAFSSLIINPLIGATLLADGIGKDSSMDGLFVKAASITVLMFGTIIAVVFQGSPIELLRTAQALAVIAFPVLGFLIWVIARDRELMGSDRNSLWEDVLSILGYLTIIGIVLNYLKQIL